MSEFEKLPLFDEEGNEIVDEHIHHDPTDELEISDEDMELYEHIGDDEAPSYQANPNKLWKIVLDPGHIGGYNRGIAPGYFEGTAMFNLAHHLKKELLKYNNTEVLVTRSKLSDNPSLDLRGKMAKGYDIFISLHSDAAGTQNAVGVSIFYSVRRPQSKKVGLTIGQTITDFMRQTTGVTKLRGAITRPFPNNSKLDYYGVIRSSVANQSVVHSFLIEHGFHTNSKECAFLNNDANLQKLAEVEARTLASILGVSKKDGASPAPEPKPAPVPTPEPKQETPKPADNGSDTFAVTNKRGIPGYNTAADALAGKNKKSHVPYGTYKVYKRHNGAINVTNKAGTPGSWINPKDNDIDQD